MHTEPFHLFLNLVSILLLICLTKMLFDFIFSSATSSSSLCCFFFTATVQTGTEDLHGKSWERLVLHLHFCISHFFAGLSLHLIISPSCSYSVMAAVIFIYSVGLLVRECTGCRGSHWWIVPWRTCPDDSTLRKSDEVITACLLSGCHTVQHWDSTADVCN